MKRKIYYQTVQCTIPAGATAGSTISIAKPTLDKDYDTCEGAVVYETSNPGGVAYRLALGINGTKIQEETHVDDWKGNTAVAIGQRYKEMNFNSSGKTAEITGTPITSPGSNITFDFVFKLIKNLED